MARNCVVTGSASGIGKATVALLEERDARVAGVDVRDAEIVADLGTPAGRAAMVDGVRATLGDTVDAVIACAGLGAGTSESIVRVNYFGAIATLRDLRPFLARGTAPGAVVIASIAMLGPVDD